MVSGELFLTNIEHVVKLCYDVKKMNRYSAFFVPSALKNALKDFECAKNTKPIQIKAIQAKAIAVHQALLQPKNRIHRLWNWFATFFFTELKTFIHIKPSLAERLQIIENYEHPDSVIKKPGPVAKIHRILPTTHVKEEKKKIKEVSKENKVFLQEEDSLKIKDDESEKRALVFTDELRSLENICIQYDEFETRQAIMNAEEKKMVGFNHLQKAFYKKCFFVEENTHRNTVALDEQKEFGPVILLHHEIEAREALVTSESTDFDSILEHYSSDVENQEIRRRILFKIRNFGILEGVHGAIRLYKDSLEEFLGERLAHELKPWIAFCKRQNALDSIEKEILSKISNNCPRKIASGLKELENKFEVKADNIVALTETFLTKRKAALDDLAKLNTSDLKRVTEGVDAAFIEKHHYYCPFGIYADPSEALQHALAEEPSEKQIRVRV